jgi:hypothetical protein
VTLEQALLEQAKRRWRVEPLPDGAYQVGNGPGYLVFSIGQSQKLQVIPLRTGQSVEASKKRALRHFKGAVDSEGHLRDDIRDLLRIGIKRPGKRPFFPDRPMRLRKRKGVPMRVGRRKRAPLPWAPRERILERIEQIITSEADSSAERSIDKLVADLKATRALLWNPERRNFLGSVAQLAQSLGQVPAMGEITKELEITQDHCSKLCKQYGYQWLPRLPSKRNNY